MGSYKRLLLSILVFYKASWSILIFYLFVTICCRIFLNDGWFWQKLPHSKFVNFAPSPNNASMIRCVVCTRYNRVRYKTVYSLKLRNMAGDLFDIRSMLSNSMFPCGKNTSWIFSKVVYFHIGGIINLPTKTRNKQHIAWKAKQAYLCGFNVSAGTPGQIAINMIWAGLWPPIWCQQPLGPFTPNSWGFTLEQERP